MLVGIGSTPNWAPGKQTRKRRDLEIYKSQLQPGHVRKFPKDSWTSGVGVNFVSGEALEKRHGIWGDVLWASIGPKSRPRIVIIGVELGLAFELWLTIPTNIQAISVRIHCSGRHLHVHVPVRVQLIHPVNEHVEPTEPPQSCELDHAHACNVKSFSRL